MLTIILQVNVKLMTQFLPDIESLIMDEQIRSLTQKLPDGIAESAEDIPTSLHNMIAESEAAAYIMTYYASHGMSNDLLQKRALSNPYV